MAFLIKSSGSQLAERPESHISSDVSAFKSARPTNRIKPPAGPDHPRVVFWIIYSTICLFVAALPAKCERSELTDLRGSSLCFL